ncbi:MAG: spermidine/putrescine transporter substrate-binding protein PotF [Gammaproteobacteria bacterium]|nr:spermidine/putrescine transporter substrate-binding protein PotF [Gammaproteobacteria bacterium]
MLLTLSACGRQPEQPKEPSTRNVNSTSSLEQDGEKILNVYSWLDYIAPETVANFEKETGIKVRYDTYDNNEVLETKLLTGHTSYDIVLPTGAFFERQRQASIYRKLDKTALPNLVNADPDIMRRLAVYDPGNLYAIPYMFTTVGLGYNVEKVHERLGAIRPDSWALLFDPDNAMKLKDCGISVVDSAMDVFEAAMIYLGRDPNRLDPRDVADASEALLKIRPFVRNIDAAPVADIANNSVCLSLGWSGDIEAARNRANEAKTGANIAYFVPREGSVITVDMLAIPADAPHPHNAEIWMNYLMRPEVMAAITNYIRYPNGYKASLPWVQASVKDDEAIYPSQATLARLISPKTVPLDYSRLVTREWTRFRTGN